MISVKLPTLLRGHAGGQPEVQSKGGSLGELLENLERRYPGLTDGLRDGRGLRRHVNVYVNGEDVRYTGGLETAVKDGDEVSILPAVAGG
ncbi:MAG TPA: ubiquitin-like small modifier protein 1 [Actinomycetota bacterium]